MPQIEPPVGVHPQRQRLPLDSADGQFGREPPDLPAPNARRQHHGPSLQRLPPLHHHPGRLARLQSLHAAALPHLGARPLGRLAEGLDDGAGVDLVVARGEDGGGQARGEQRLDLGRLVPAQPVDRDAVLGLEREQPAQGAGAVPVVGHDQGAGVAVARLDAGGSGELLGEARPAAQALPAERVEVELLEPDLR